MQRIALIVAAFLLLIGCGDLDAKPDSTNNSGNNSVDAGQPDLGESDAGTDAGGSFGEVCGGPDGELVSQECSLVDQDCEEGACEKRIILDGDGMPTGFAVVCSGDIIDSSLAEGDPCDVAADECPNNMVCKRRGSDEARCFLWCRLADGYGCDPAQACVPSSDLEPVFGVCADACPAG